MRTTFLSNVRRYALMMVLVASSPAALKAASYSETVLGTPGVLAYYRMNEHPAEIGDALINGVAQSPIHGVWGFGDGNPDSLPKSGDPGPIPSNGFGGFEADNRSAYFAGPFADDDGDGTTSNNVADQMDLGTPSELDSEFATVSFFMKANGDGNDSRIFATEQAAEHHLRLVYGSNPDYGAFIIVTSPDDATAASSRVTSGTAFGDDQWHHVVVVRNGDLASNAKMYVDGVDISPNFVDAVDTFGHSDSTARIGARHGTSNQGWGSFTGSLDEFAYWNRALTPAEVQSLYSSAKGSVGIPGDFDGNGSLDIADLNSLHAQVVAGTNGATYDLNKDQLVNGTDLATWVRDLKKSWMGDANLDGQFNSSDLVDIFAAGKYEADAPANWNEGDWDGDGKFGSGDLVVAFGDGGYEKGARASVAAVPEPSTVGLLVVGMLAWGILAKRR